MFGLAGVLAGILSILKNISGIYRKGQLPTQDLKFSVMPDSSHKTISQFHFLMPKDIFVSVTRKTDPQYKKNIKISR